MNDGNDKHEGAWWGNLETLKPSQVQSDYSYVDEDDRRKKFIITAVNQYLDPKWNFGHQQHGHPRWSAD